MNNTQNKERSLVTIYCARCGKKETITLTSYQDYVYLEDIKKEMGWKNNRCPKCSGG